MGGVRVQKGSFANPERGAAFAALSPTCERNFESPDRSISNVTPFARRGGFRCAQSPFFILEEYTPLLAVGDTKQDQKLRSHTNISIVISHTQ